MFTYVKPQAKQSNSFKFCTSMHGYIMIYGNSLNDNRELSQHY